MSDPIAYINHGSDGREGGDNNWRADLEAIKQNRIFHRALVIDTLCDPSLRTAPPETLTEDAALNYASAPRNSLVCRILTDESNESDATDIICYPFFSSHVALPVKPGEQVWVFRERFLADPRRGVSYWISRVTGELAQEDANLTPFTRATNTFITSSITPGPDRKVDFPNENSPGYPLISGEEDALQKIILNAAESSQTAIEPIPRVTKRPGDLVLQGSNNALISLGTDKGFDFQQRPENREKSVTSDGVNNDSGAIDIVAGRGRYFDTSEEEIKKSRKGNAAKGQKNSTKPFLVANTLGKFETDKNPGETQEKNAEEANGKAAPPKPGNLKTNPSEGDPDFLVDAARIYVSENSDIDNRLGLAEIKAKGFDRDYESVEPSPCVAVKSDHVRIVARQVPISKTEGKLPDKFESANGTIRIVKEGDPDKDLAVIYVESDGTIQISGSKIFLGRQSSDGGKVDGEEQPYVRYKELEELWGKTMDELNNFCQTLLTHVTPGYGSPSPQINKAATDLQSQIPALKDEIQKIKSERIFGE